MKGNKPLKGVAGAFAPESRFTARMAANPKVAYFPYPGGKLLVTMVVDQILVGKAAANNQAVRAALERIAVPRGLVFDVDGQPGGENIAIWQLNHTPNDQPHADVAEAVWAMRKVLDHERIGREQVAPNHVLIPANYHSCPWSPPKEPDGDPFDLGEPDGSVTVTVIDSGYQADGPIESRVDVTRGKWFAKTAGGYAWVDESVDMLDSNNDGRLDALVGHANFVAGVVAHMCPRATIKVVSHNGAFVNSDISKWAIPTEASVARSLWNSRGSDVINVGFAFPTLPAIRPVKVVKDGPKSWALDLVLGSIHRAEVPPPVIVAPAGNQATKRPQYPAAFHAAYPNVIGVGSVSSAGLRSSFSNHGPWVTCCTTGEDVISTFIDAGEKRWPTEDAEPPGFAHALTHPPKKFSGWASWSGTSFAAPKIAGAIACRFAGMDLTPLAAWNELRAGKPSPTRLDMGILIRDPSA